MGIPEALQIAARWLEAGSPTLTKQLLEQLEVVWPEDARIPYLRGLAERALGDEGAASKAFARALRLSPNSPVARYELAQSLLAQQSWDRSAYHFRFLIADETPDQIRAQVYRALSHIEDRRRWRFNADVAIEPSNNINSAPSDPEIDPIFGTGAGAVLTEESTAVSGAGIRGRLGVIRYVPVRAMDAVDRRARLLFGASVTAVDQSDSRFDDLSAGLTGGVTVRNGRNTFEIDGTLQERWFGGDHYESVSGAGLSFRRHLLAPFILNLDLNYSERNNQQVDALDGGYTTVGTRVRWQPTLTQSVDFALSAGRMDATASSQSFDEGSLGATYSSSLSRGLDFSAGASVNLRTYDTRDPFFNVLREDEIWSLSATALQRDQQILGFAPYLRVRWTRGDSTLKIHEFDRTEIRVGLTSVY